MKAVVFLMSALASAVVMADTIQLKSGSTLTGKVVSMSRDEIVFESDDLGEVTVKVEKIAKLEDQGDHVVQFNDNSSETKKLAVENGAYLADGDTLDAATVKAIDPGVETWHGEINVAYTAARGNTYENTASIFGKVTRRWEDDRLRLEGGYYTSRTGATSDDARTTTDRWEVEGQEDHFWTTTFYNYVNLKYETDKVADLNARYRAGLGLGYQWLEDYQHDLTGKWNFNQEIGANYIKEEYEGDNEDSKKDGFAALRYAHHFTYNPKWNEDVEIFHNLEYLPEVDEWSKYLVKTDIGISTKIIGNFDLSAKIEFDYNSKPANDRKKDDVRYIVGLGYKW